MQNSLFDHLYNIGVIPVLEIDRGADAVPLAQALLAGGLSIAEVTLRTGRAALEAIERIHIARAAWLLGSFVRGGWRK